MKKKYLTLGIILVLVFGFGLAATSSPKTFYIKTPIDQTFQPSAVIWSDNFTDGDMDGWVTWAWPDLESNFTVIDGCVYSQGEDLINIAGHESTLAYGTWSFDILIGGYQYSGVQFISMTELTEGASIGDGYELAFSTESRGGVGQPSIQLFEHGSTADFLGYHIMNLAGWHHVDITRDARGFFCVYMNGSLVIEAVDETITTSTAFGMVFEENAGCGFDNVVVSNTIDVDLAGPRYTGEPTDQTISEGEGFMYVINATDVHYVDLNSWAVNDTVNFAIDRNGVITNATSLEPGVYGLEVSVADTWDNVRTATFSVTVVAGATPFDPTILAVAGGAGVVVVLVILVIFLKKRS
ncbi:MAG: hypothetical protein ACXAEF_11590 [Candidatus Thorarchaeota archaeon]|jgi:hypothetical protein